MSLVWVIYWIDVIANLNAIFVVSFILWGMAFVMCGVMCLVSEGKLISFAAFEKIAKIFIPFIIVSAFINVFIPEKKTMYMMAAARAGELVVQSDDFRETYGKIKTLLDVKLDDMLKQEKK